MYLEVSERDLPSCPSESQYYVCQANNFRGCCLVNACNYGGVCPIPPSASSSSSSSSFGISSTITLTTQAPPSPTVPSSPSKPTTTSYSSSSSITTSRSAQSSQLINVAGSTNLASVTTATPLPASSSSITNASIASNPVKLFMIIGISCGTVVVAIFILLIGLCIRNRSQKKAAAKRPFGTDAKDKLLIGRPERPLHNEDIFAPFGGYHRDTPSPGHLLRYQTYEVEAPLHSPAPSYPYTDVEKTGPSPPPVHEHPAFHPLPGMSTRVPSYQPEDESTLLQYPGTLSSQVGTYESAVLPRSPSPAYLDSTPISPHAELSAFLSPTPPPSHNPVLNSRIVDSEMVNSHIINPQMAGSQLMTSHIELPPVSPRPLFSPRAIPPNSPRHHPNLSSSPRNSTRNLTNISSNSPPKTLAPAENTETYSSLYSIPDGVSTTTRLEMQEQKRLQQEIEQHMSNLSKPDTESHVLLPNLASSPEPLPISNSASNNGHKRANSQKESGSDHVMSWATYGGASEVNLGNVPGGNGRQRKMSDVSPLGKGETRKGGSPMSPLEEKEERMWRGFNRV